MTLTILQLIQNHTLRIHPVKELLTARKGHQKNRPCWLIKEHNWRIVDKFQSYRQPLALSTRQIRCSRGF